jgi:hypothetical protein
MKQVLLAAAVAVAMIGTAHAQPNHKWYMVDYSNGDCKSAPVTPEQFYNLASVSSARTGISMDRIAPENVTKDDNGGIHVHMTGNRPDGGAQWDFFTSKAACNKYVKDEGIAPEQAPSDDIN